NAGNTSKTARGMGRRRFVLGRGVAALLAAGAAFFFSFPGSAWERKPRGSASRTVVENVRDALARQSTSSSRSQALLGNARLPSSAWPKRRGPRPSTGLEAELPALAFPSGAWERVQLLSFLHHDHAGIEIIHPRIEPGRRQQLRRLAVVEIDVALTFA